MQIIRERQRHQDTHYLRTYAVKGTGCGYSFNCDESGEVDVENMKEARVNWDYCQAGLNERGETITFTGVRESVHGWIEETVGRCDDCDTEVELGKFTNTCEKCGADYSSAGQRLAPREQWGEETGEHPADISRIP